MELKDIYRGYSSNDILCKLITGQVKPEKLEY